MSAVTLTAWAAEEPDESDAAELTDLLRRHESRGRGWAGASEDDLLVEVSARGALTRQNVVLRDDEGVIRGWASAHDRAAGRMLLVVVVDHLLEDSVADRVAETLLAWADEAARRVGAERGLDVQQIDSGAFADDERQHRWLRAGGFEKVRTWWQMTPAGHSRRGRHGRGGQGGRAHPAGTSARAAGCPTRTTFAPCTTCWRARSRTTSTTTRRPSTSSSSGCARTRATAGTTGGSPSCVDGDEVEPVGCLVGSFSEGSAGKPDGSYVEYIGVLQSARGRGVAKSLLQHDHRRRCGERSRPRGPRGGRRLPDGGGRPLRLDGLEDQVRHRVVAP